MDLCFYSMTTIVLLFSDFVYLHFLTNTSLFFETTATLSAAKD